MNHDGRTLSEVIYEERHGILDRADWPSVGDEVLYRRGDTGKWTTAIVTEVAQHDGDLDLKTPDSDVECVDAKHGSHPHGWLLYGETP